MTNQPYVGSGRLRRIAASASRTVSVIAFVACFGIATFGAQQAPPPAQPASQAPPAQAGGRGLPGTESGFATFQTRCVLCHANSESERAKTPAGERAPTTDAIRLMTPERIYAALATGSMQVHAKDLSDTQKTRLAEFMSSRPMGSAGTGDAAKMANRCTTNPAMTDPARSASWNGWGNGVGNTRFQPAAAARLTAAQVPQLKLKWVFGYPNGITSNAQPTIVSGRVFVGSDNGYLYSLDAKTGCVYWSFETGSIIRNAPTVGPVSGQGNARYAVFVGDGHANVYALDAQTGRQLWKTKTDPHFVARITAGTTFYNGRLFVPVSSSEEFSSGNADYSCCTARGSVVALDANTGKQIWKSWVVPEEPKPYLTQPNGVVLYKPAGGAVWNSPTVDPLRNAVYFGTGDATTAPPQTIDPRAPRPLALIGPPAALMRKRSLPLASGSSAITSALLVPMSTARRFPSGSVVRIGELPMSMSGPIGLGHAALRLAPVQPPMNTSPSVAWYDQSSFPVLMSTAMMPSVVTAGGAVVASPVPKYTALRTGSTVGEFQTAPPAGL